MKRITILWCAVLTALTFSVGIWLFFPWQLVSAYAISRGQTTLAQNGFYLNVINAEARKGIIPVITLRGLSIENTMMDMNLDRVSIRVLPLSSVLNMAPTIGLNLGKSEITAPGNISAGWEQGQMRVSASRLLTKFSGINLKGDIAAEGDLFLQRGKLAGGALSITIPPNLDVLLQPFSKGIPYLSAEGNGKWRVASDAKAN